MMSNFLSIRKRNAFKTPIVIKDIGNLKVMTCIFINILGKKRIGSEGRNLGRSNRKISKTLNISNSKKSIEENAKVNIHRKLNPLRIRHHNSLKLSEMDWKEIENIHWKSMESFQVLKKLTDEMSITFSICLL